MFKFVSETSEVPLLVEVWSDVVCPWCYIGKRRLESAIAQFAHGDAVEVKWKSFQLDSSAPTDSNETVVAHLSSKYGVSVDEAREMNTRVTTLAAEEGLKFSIEDAKVTNTFAAHRLLHFAATHGLRNDLKEQLLRAHFIDKKNVGDIVTLVGIAAEVGLDAEEARSVLTTDEFAPDVVADVDEARSLGATGVPFFVIDRKYGISGAQSSSVFLDVLERSWNDQNPSLISAGEVGESCAPGEACD